MTMPPAMHAAALPELTIVHAAAQREAWLAALDEGAGAAALALDLSAVTEIDSAGVQLLLALHGSLVERGRELRLHAPNSLVLEALRTLGLAGLLMPPAHA
jgi:anti-anti-sigma factor